MTQGTLELRVAEPVAGLFELRGLHTGARQEQLVGHFSEHQPRCRSREREEGRTVQNLSKNFRVLRVGEWVGRPDINRPPNGVVLEGVDYRADDVVEGDPAPVLMAVPDPASPSHTWQTSARKLFPGPLSSRSSSFPRSP